MHEFLSLPKRLFAKNTEEIHMKTTGERIRLFLEELGPTFVKLGQIASTRPDLVPAGILAELAKLQDHVAPFSFEEVKRIVELELGAELEELFDQFEEEPSGAASIGQVHFAVLQNGEKVAVKIQRPNIEQMMKTDLEILQEIARLAEHRLEWAAQYQVSEIVEEFSKALLAELDYSVEGRNADKIAKQFKNDEHILVPKVYWDYSTKKILTMECIEGVKLNEINILKHDGYDTKLLAERVVHSIFHQILNEGFFHGDPHPGNVSALPGNKIVFIDFGMVGRLTPQMKANFASLVVAMMRQSTDGIIRVIMRMGIVPEDVDIGLLKADVESLNEKYYDVPLSKVSLGEAVNDLFSIAHYHKIQIPADLTLVGKTLLTMEGLVEKLDPEISIIKIAEPFGRELIKERYRPDHIAKRMITQWNEYWDIFIDSPKHMRELAGIIKKGKIPMEVSMPNIELFLTKLDRISNRLSFSIVLLSFSIIMVGLIIGSALGGQASLLWNLPAIEIGFIIALLMFLWLIFSIFRSGRF